MGRIRLLLAFGIIALIIAFSSSSEFRNVYSLPPHLRVIEGEAELFNVNFPLTIDVYNNSEETIRLQSSMPVYAISRNISLEPLKLGKSSVEFKLFGLIPIKKIEVDVLPPIKLIPGGHSIGVVLRSNGVIVVGTSPVKTEDGQMFVPAKDAGISIGDVILSINGIPAESDTQVAEIINQAGRHQQLIDILLKRGDEKLQIAVNPIMCAETKRFRIGLFVRDSAAGVGTLTFYEPNSKKYGALGHIITDSDTNQPIDCQQGRIVLASVSGIQQGKRGQPGEKIGVFIEDDNSLGNIKKNTHFGIYGQLTAALPNSIYTEAIPIASMNQIQNGYAEMLTVVDGDIIEPFGIEIQKINLQDNPDGKGLIIKATDPRLLEKTGGIIQGMSGSPIVQNGKIIGAVTHVFVHDPTKGYGCFIDWMLMESDIIPKNKSQMARKLFSFFWPFLINLN